MSHENLRGVRGAFGRGVLRGKILPHKGRRADGNGDYAGVGIEGQISRKVRLYVLRGPATDTKNCTTVAARSRMMQTAGPWGSWAVAYGTESRAPASGSYSLPRNVRYKLTNKVTVNKW